MIKKLTFLLITLAATAGCRTDVLGAGTPSDPATESFATSLAVDLASSSRTASGVYYRDVRVGTGDQAAAEDQVTITYAGYLKDGTPFGSQSTPQTYSLSIFVPGFRDGVVGMRAGGVRKLVIPSALGYGWQGLQRNGEVVIPRNATLVFDVELFAVTKPTTTSQ
jgi:FKBP-type peptidyl-prolyl cis-trans isomerase FkpA